MDEDSELGDFDPQNDSEAQTEEQNDSDGYPPEVIEEMEVQQVNVPHLRNSRSEYDRQIRPGDVVRDQWGGGWLIVFRKSADTVREYDAQQDDTKPSLLSYEGSIGTGATEEDAVWVCFYLNKNNTLAGGRSGPYDFPESRIVRYAYEATDGFKKGRFQDLIQDQVMEQMAAQALATGEPDQIEAVEQAMKAAFGTDRKDRAFEVAEAGDPR